MFRIRGRCRSAISILDFRFWLLDFGTEVFVSACDQQETRTWRMD